MDNNFHFLKNLFPDWLRFRAMALRGDFDKHPGARAASGPMARAGWVTVFFAFLAAGMGFPLYKDLILSIVNGLDSDLPLFWVISKGAWAGLITLVCVSWVSGSINSFQTSAAMYRAENKRFAHSRVNSDQYKRYIYFLVFMGLVDMSMNFGGRFVRLKTEHKEGIEQAAGAEFVFDRIDDLNRLYADIEQIEHPKGCNGHYACKKNSVCPKHPGGSIHNPGGKLTSFGNSLLKEKKATLANLEYQYNADKEAHITVRGTRTSTVKEIGGLKKYLNYVWIIVIYFAMWQANLVKAGAILSFEAAAKVLPDYHAILEQDKQTANIARQRKLLKDNEKKEHITKLRKKDEVSRSRRGGDRLKKFQERYGQAEELDNLSKKDLIDILREDPKIMEALGIKAEASPTPPEEEKQIIGFQQAHEKRHILEYPTHKNWEEILFLLKQLPGEDFRKIENELLGVRGEIAEMKAGENYEEKLQELEGKLNSTFAENLELRKELEREKLTGKGKGKNTPGNFAGKFLPNKKKKASPFSPGNQPVNKRKIDAGKYRKVISAAGKSLEEKGNYNREYIFQQTGVSKPTIRNYLGIAFEKGDLAPE